VLGVRPERLSVGPAAESGNAVTVTLSDIMHLGSKTHLHGAAAGDDRVLCEVPGSADLSGLHEGAPVRLGWAVADTLAYPVAP
jgi:putative spermidine/putrescine transport system ATP-binding protein